MGNLGLRDGGQVRVSPVPLVPASRVVLAGPVGVVAAVSPEMLRLALLGKVLTAGDDVSLLPQDVLPDASVRSLVEAARRSLANTVGFAWTSTLLTVVTVEPAAGALVTMDTVIGWEHGATTHGGPAPVGTAPGTSADPVPVEDAPDVDELPGLRAQAEELTELLDLGFHHREVLGRLGTTISLGVLLGGPAGSGKSALVRAVAARVGARVHPLWAPEVAALTSQAAAERLRVAATAARAGGPAVLLVTDVEALAPADDPGPVATVFRQVLAESIRAGVAVVCTTGRSEAVDPALRSPDLLSLRISVPLPDQALRREQLTVLTRQVPLADDVRLDDVAARTPGSSRRTWPHWSGRPGYARHCDRSPRRHRRCRWPTSPPRGRWSGPPRWRRPPWIWPR